MLMCREATRLMSLKQDKILTLREKMALRLHLSMCRDCRHCARQFDLLRFSVSELLRTPDKNIV